MHAGTRHIGGVEPLDPCLYRSHHAWLTANGKNCVSPGDHLELDHIMAKAALLGIQDLLQLGDDRLGIAIVNRENSDRFSTHPINIETKHRLDGGTTFLTAALNKQHRSEENTSELQSPCNLVCRLL